MSKLYRVAEVMERLSLSHTSIYREMKSGRLAYIQRGPHRLFEEQAIGAYISSLKSDGAEELLALVDEEGRVDVLEIPEGCTLADLAEVKRLVAERKAVA